MRPYIGITGFSSVEEIQQVYNSAPVLKRQDRPKGSHDLMIGLLASSKTMQGQTNRYAHRYPDTLQLDKLCQARPGAINLIHFHSPDSFALELALGILTERSGVKNLHGFQLNLVWPDVKQLCRHKERYPDQQLVLQVSSRAFGEANNDPKTVAARLHEYAYCVDRVLLDASGGRGVLLDLDQISRYVDALQDTEFGVGVAGGLCAESLAQLALLVTQFPWLSIDAESRLRRPDDTLDMVAAQAYLRSALELFCELVPEEGSTKVDCSNC